MRKRTRQKKEFAVIESMTEFEFKGYDVRVWREEKELETAGYYPETHLRLMRELEDKYGKVSPTRVEVARALAGVKRVSAVEVTVSGQGLVIYTEWP